MTQTKEIEWPYMFTYFFCVSSGPHYQAEFWYMESGLLPVVDFKPVFSVCFTTKTLQGYFPQILR